MGFGRSFGHEWQSNDTVVTAWIVLALKTAKGCEIAVDSKGFAKAQNWLDYVYSEKNNGKHGKKGIFAYGKRKFRYHDVRAVGLVGAFQP